MTLSVPRLLLGFLVLVVLSLLALASWAGCFALPKLFGLPVKAGWVFFAVLMMIWTECQPLLSQIVGFQEASEPEEEIEQDE